MTPRDIRDWFRVFQQAIVSALEKLKATGGDTANAALDEINTAQAHVETDGPETAANEVTSLTKKKGFMERITVGVKVSYTPILHIKYTDKTLNLIVENRMDEAQRAAEAGEGKEAVGRFQASQDFKVVTNKRNSILGEVRHSGRWVSHAGKREKLIGRASMSQPGAGLDDKGNRQKTALAGTSHAPGGEMWKSEVFDWMLNMQAKMFGNRLNDYKDQAGWNTRTKSPYVSHVNVLYSGMDKHFELEESDWLSGVPEDEEEWQVFALSLWLRALLNVPIPSDECLRHFDAFMERIGEEQFLQDLKDLLDANMVDDLAQILDGARKEARTQDTRNLKEDGLKYLLNFLGQAVFDPPIDPKGPRGKRGLEHDQVAQVMISAEHVPQQFDLDKKAYLAKVENGEIEFNEQDMPLAFYKDGNYDENDHEGSLFQLSFVIWKHIFLGPSAAAMHGKTLKPGDRNSFSQSKATTHGLTKATEETIIYALIQMNCLYWWDNQLSIKKTKAKKVAGSDIDVNPKSTLGKTREKAKLRAMFGVAAKAAAAVGAQVLETTKAKDMDNDESIQDVGNKDHLMPDWEEGAFAETQGVSGATQLGGRATSDADAGTQEESVMEPETEDENPRPHKSAKGVNPHYRRSTTLRVVEQSDAEDSEAQKAQKPTSSTAVRRRQAPN
ncbi:hypothetical protein AAF712_007363 [Marasmius tenuissimus]|uniref:Uncharacterized protein n=1 Tax=Marasmius tenuissimus TaxID=585030 RepID=A0ABR2ZW88_9AGAR